MGIKNYLDKKDTFSQEDTIEHEEKHNANLEKEKKSIEENPEEEVDIHPEESIKAENENPVEGPIGLDIGTTNIVLAYKQNADIRMLRQLNAFFTLPFSQLTKEALTRDGIMFFEKDSQLYVLSHPAEDFASIFGSHTRRPIESGMLNPKEDECESVIKAIVNQLVPRAEKTGEKICFSIPGEPVDQTDSSLVYHESIIKIHLTTLGYTPIPINEGLSVVLSELSDNNFTGLGISMGGGMCNVCFSYLTVPVVFYSIQKGGDYIDSMVGQSVGESLPSIREIKEKELDLSIAPRNRIENGLHIYYDDLFATLAKSLELVLGKSEKIPRLNKPIPIVLGGGTALPRGSRERFEKALKEVSLPIQISDIMLSKDPLHSTAKGALMMALLDS
jgi:hypothetical protein